MDIVEIIRKFEQGATEPYLCRTENGERYVVKGRSAPVKERISEYLCAMLGRDFGLPIPECELLSVPEELVEYSGEYSQGLGAGTAFGSTYVTETQEVNREILKHLPVETLRELWVFDYWIKNEDRTLTVKGGNPNLFYRPRDKKLIVVDHNLAFDADFSLESFRRLHLVANAGLLPELEGVGDEDYKQRMTQAMENFDGYCDNLPPEWLGADTSGREWVAQIRRQLLEFEDNSFWEALK
jgi:hypothetical protein